LNEGVASVSEINTTLKLQQIGHRWFTKDERATYRKRKEGWIVDAISDPVCKAFEEYSIISTIEDAPTFFPSLKAARQAVSEVSLEVGLNIDTGLTRGNFGSYKIKDLPLYIKESGGARVAGVRVRVASSPEF
jgi:hypothetical protein